MDSLLIDITLKEIGKSYEPGAMRWTKKTRPREWSRLLMEEMAINKAAMEGGATDLKESLSRYQKLISSLCTKFKEEV